MTPYDVIYNGDTFNVLVDGRVIGTATSNRDAEQVYTDYAADLTSQGLMCSAAPMDEQDATDMGDWWDNSEPETASEYAARIYDAEHADDEPLDPDATYDEPGEAAGADAAPAEDEQPELDEVTVQTIEAWLKAHSLRFGFAFEDEAYSIESAWGILLVVDDPCTLRCTSGHCDRAATTTLHGYGFCGVCAAEQAALLDVPPVDETDVAAIVASVTAQQQALVKGQAVIWKRKIGKRYSRIHPTNAVVVRCNRQSVTIHTAAGTDERVAYADVYAAASWNSGAQEAA